MFTIDILSTIFAYLFFLIIIESIYFFKSIQLFNLFFNYASNKFLIFIYFLFPNYFNLITKYLGLFIILILNFYHPLVIDFYFIKKKFSYFEMFLFFENLFNLNLNMFLNQGDILNLSPIVFHF